MTGLVSSASAISVSGLTTLAVLLWPRGFFGGMARVGAEAGAMGGGFGGPGAIATGFLVVGLSPLVLVGVVAEVPVPVEPAADLGESASFALAEVLLDWAIEFLRLAILRDREEVLVDGLPLPRLRFLMTSVFKLSGRTTPCNLRNKPQALQSG